MSYIETIAKSFAIDITKPRKYNYSHDILQEFLAFHTQLGCLTFKVKNNRHEHIQTMLLKHTKTNSCIIYAHGLGSNKLQALSIAKNVVRFGFDVCSFDFSSSGRSEGEYTSYGMREQDDITAILSHLDQHYQYERYVLWGRSMGSVSIVLSQGKCLNRKVQCIILDSPFSSFEKVAIELASKKSFIPEFMLSILIEPLKGYFQKHHPVNPFEIDVCDKIQRITCKILMIYSKHDSVVHYNHSKLLSQFCRTNPMQVEIKEDHNMHRGKSTHQRIMVFIDNCIEERERKAARGLSSSKNRGISVASIDGKRESKQKCIRSSKIKLIRSNVSAKIKLAHSSEVSMTTLTTLNESLQYTHHLQTQFSPCEQKCRVEMRSLYDESTLTMLQQNKQNIKPSLNLMRKNRFR